MTREHIERIAQVFSVNKYAFANEESFNDTIDDMCVELKAINPRFNEETFRKTCNNDCI
jgi:hypothetical protein